MVTRTIVNIHVEIVLIASAKMAGAGPVAIFVSITSLSLSGHLPSGAQFADMV